jgi:hypothetical protein
MQVPETVRRIFHLYEEKHVRPLLARQTLLRWWMRRWRWISHLQLRAILKIEIQVWEILTEIENLKLEVEFLKLDVNPSREPIKASSVKDQANLAKTLRASRAIKVNLRIRAFRIQSLAAWVQDLVTEMRRRATNNEKKKKTTKKLKKKTETEKKADAWQQCSCCCGNRASDPRRQRARHGCTGPGAAAVERRRHRWRSGRAGRHCELPCHGLRCLCRSCHWRRAHAGPHHIPGGHLAT